MIEKCDEVGHKDKDFGQLFFSIYVGLLKILTK